MARAALLLRTMRDKTLKKKRKQWKEKYASYSSHDFCKSLSEELSDYYGGRHRSHPRSHSHRREKEKNKIDEKREKHERREKKAKRENSQSRKMGERKKEREFPIKDQKKTKNQDLK